jgi:hypothetical protein
MNKKLSNYLDLGRTKIGNHLRSALTTSTMDSTTGKYDYRLLTVFLPSVWWPWLTSYLGGVLKPRVDFPPAPSANNSLYRLGAGGDSLRVAIAGDWGTGTDEAEEVMARMMDWDGSGAPDLTVHLGDVYYVGGESEIAENCNGQNTGDTPPIEGVLWQQGSKGTFALCGNHEMYATGGPYYTDFLPKLKMPDGTLGQGCSFFCLENSNWRILGLDTGYNSVKSPFISWIPGQGADCAFEDTLIAWIRNVVKPASSPKATIVLTHHQYFSGFEEQYPVPAKQLEEFFTTPIIWLWGHEHRLSAYKLFGTGALQVYGRCIGHGGMPIEAVDPDVPGGIKKFISGDPNKPARDNLLFYDKRPNPLYPLVDGSPPIGLNGFVRLSLNGPQATLDYLSLQANPASAGAGKPDYLPTPTTLYSETFTCSGPLINPPVGRTVTADANFVQPS